MSERLPPPQPARFPELQTDHIVELAADTLVGRIHFQSGDHPYRWDQFRRWAPPPHASTTTSRQPPTTQTTACSTRHRACTDADLCCARASQRSSETEV